MLEESLRGGSDMLGMSVPHWLFFRGELHLFWQRCHMMVRWVQPLPCLAKPDRHLCSAEEQTQVTFCRWLPLSGSCSKVFLSFQLLENSSHGILFPRKRNFLQMIWCFQIYEGSRLYFLRLYIKNLSPFRLGHQTQRRFWCSSFPWEALSSAGFWGEAFGQSPACSPKLCPVDHFCWEDRRAADSLRADSQPNAVFAQEPFDQQRMLNKWTKTPSFKAE